MQGGVSNAAQSPDLQSLGRVNYQIYWIFYRATETLGDLRQIKGKRVGLGPQGSGQRPMTEKILAASGINSENTTFVALSTQAAAEPSATAISMSCFCHSRLTRTFYMPC